MMNRYILLCLSVFCLLSCDRTANQTYTLGERTAIDSTVKANSASDSSLNVLLKNYVSTENVLGMMLTYKQLGKNFRNTAQFNEAINFHRQQLRLAAQLADTLEMIQALNNIGTNFRRMGILPEASTCHYKALTLCDQYHDRQSFTAKKIA